MNTTTVNSMNFLALKNDGKMDAAVPTALKKAVEKMAIRKGMNKSVYMKVALINQLERDSAEFGAETV